MNSCYVGIFNHGVPVCLGLILKGVAVFPSLIGLSLDNIYDPGEAVHQSFVREARRFFHSEFTTSQISLIGQVKLFFQSLSTASSIYVLLVGEYKDWDLLIFCL